MESRHELLLQACFGRAADSRRALAACEGIPLDAAVKQLLPFVYHKWKGFANNSLVEAGHRAYLTTWRQNREPLTAIREVLTGLRKEGADCMLLKGAALTLRHYRDYGLRNMGDFDVMIRPEDLERALRFLRRHGWVAEGECGADAIVRQSRVRHVWKFSRGETEHCDLHWRPLAQCNSPKATEMFWLGAETADLDGLPVKVPCATDQFFHTCVHAMHWEWTPNLYWFADALVLLGQGKVDWERAWEIARHSQTTVRFAEAVAALKARFDVRIVDLGDGGAGKWQRREFEVMQKACPLEFRDRIRWHAYHFRRLRPHDPVWKGAPVWAGFADYLRVFLDAANLPETARKVWAEIR